MKFKNMELQKIAHYVKERIPIEEITTSNYISTENLLPEKMGKVKATKLPDAKTAIKYKPGDILISNIRPYFKKIWFALGEGGASSDVLVIRPETEMVDPLYLFYFLSSNRFFDYMTSTSKGTKMPRGDKQAVMTYSVPLPNKEEQSKVGRALANLDEKIDTNNKIISTLEELAQTLFKRWFIDFEFPNDDGEPYRSSGGKMVESELSQIPEGWSVSSVSDVAAILSGGTPKTSESTYWNGSIQFYTPKDANNSFYVFSTEKKLTTEGLNNCSSQLYGENTIFITARGTVGKLNLAMDSMAMNQSCYALKHKEGKQLFLFLALKRLVRQIIHSSNGAVFNAITKRDFRVFKLVNPPIEIINRFEKEIDALFAQIKTTTLENEKLRELRDTLLPKLLSGEIEINEEAEVGDDVVVP